MARKRTKGKPTKKVASRKRRTGKVSTKPRRAASKASAPKAETAESPRAMNLLRAWSPSRYSTR